MKTVLVKFTLKEAKHIKELAEQELEALGRIDQECCGKEQEQLNSIANKVFKAIKDSK